MVYTNAIQNLFYNDLTIVIKRYLYIECILSLTQKNNKGGGTCDSYFVIATKESNKLNIWCTFVAIT